ncbi:hypothetical protein HDV03_005461 [Kappamyces sp. JEL0829]|nr:hypothetical protein HDV03_005461 [Kappamyces sp. JEL0829]
MKAIQTADVAIMSASLLVSMAIISYIILRLRFQKTYEKWFLVLQLLNVVTQLCNVCSVFVDGQVGAAFFAWSAVGVLVDILGICLTDVQIWEIFSCLNDFTSSERLHRIRIVLCVLFCGLCSLQIVWFVVPAPFPGSFGLIAQMLSMLWVLFAILFDNALALYLSIIILRWKSSNQPDPATLEFQRILLVIVSTSLMDWLALGLFVWNFCLQLYDDAATKELQHDLNRMIYAICGIHCNAIVWYFFQLKALAFKGVPQLDGSRKVSHESYTVPNPESSHDPATPADGPPVFSFQQSNASQPR